MADRSISDVGKFLQKYGLKIGEHPEFGGVAGVHAKGSYHYAPGGAAIDVTDWRPDVAPAYEGGKPIPWKQRTGELSWRAKQLGLFSEALGPGDKGHETHVHLALPSKKPISDQQLEWLATGRTKDPQGRLTDVMPGAMQTQQAQQMLQGQQAAQQSKGNTYIIVPNSSTKEGESQDFLASYLQNMMQTPQLKSSINPTALLMQAINQTPNYFES
jgi:hypothetical protein